MKNTKGEGRRAKGEGKNKKRSFPFPFSRSPLPLSKRTALITAGPTREKIDPVRFISNFSSGKQGYAIAKAFKKAGYEVTLISGPVNLPVPKGIKIINVESADEMLDACINALPTDIAIFTAAVCDFKPLTIAKQKLKKEDGVSESTIKLTQNIDILKTISNHKSRPKLVIGFAAETENLIKNAMHKLSTKGCDVIVANNVTDGSIFGSDTTSVSVITHHKIEEHNNVSKSKVASELEYIISNMLMNKNI